MTSRAPRRPRVTAAAGLVLVAVVVMGAFRADQLPFLNAPSTTFSAALTDASGLRAGDAVEVAGVRVGAVREMRIAADTVIVEFDVAEEIHLGPETTAAIKVGSLLGSKYLELVSGGSGQLETGALIPVGRTKPAYDVVTAFGDLTHTVERLDTDSISNALDSISDTLEGSPQEIRDAARGLTRFSAAISTRDRELRSLFHHVRNTSKVLDRRSDDIVGLIQATNLLLQELSGRKQLIHHLLESTRSLGQELSGLISDNQRTLTPALTNLNGVTLMLERHQKHLRLTIRSLDNYARVFTNTVGSGPWFDSFIPGVPDSVRVTRRIQ